ncbi:hypothetical protein VP01_7096g1, partial [Puccinia sorghi]
PSWKLLSSTFWTHTFSVAELWMVIGNVNVIVHKRPIKGIKCLENGTLGKDSEPGENEYQLSSYNQLIL